MGWSTVWSRLLSSERRFSYSCLLVLARATTVCLGRVVSLGFCGPGLIFCVEFDSTLKQLFLFGPFFAGVKGELIGIFFFLVTSSQSPWSSLFSSLLLVIFPLLDSKLIGEINELLPFWESCIECD